MCKPTKIDRTNIIPMINLATPFGFGNVKGNRTAIAERGWGPLNRACLTDTEVLSSRVDEETGELVVESQETTLSQETIANLNLNARTAGNVIGMINQEHGRRAAQNKEHVKRRKKQRKREKGKELADMHGRMSSGNMYKEGLARLDCPKVLELVKRKTVAKLAEEPRKAAKHYEKEKKIFDEAMELRQSDKAEQNWSSTDYTVMIKFKLLRTSNFWEERPKMPSLKAERQGLWEELRNKQDPEPPQRPDGYSSSEEDDSERGPPKIPRGSSADEYSSSEDGRESGPPKIPPGISADEYSSSEDDSEGSPVKIPRGISADEYSSEHGDIHHFSSDEESSNGGGPPTIPRGVSADEYSSDEESNNGGDPPTKVRAMSTDESGSEDDDWMFNGYGQRPIASICPARQSEASELTVDDVGEQAAV
jgi:hypothetical protein